MVAAVGEAKPVVIIGQFWSICDENTEMMEKSSARFRELVFLIFCQSLNPAFQLHIVLVECIFSPKSQYLAHGNPVCLGELLPQVF